MMRAMRLSILLAALLACLASVLGPGDDDIPEPDTCDGASQSGALDLAILWAASAGTESKLQDYQEVTTVSGSQGGSMLRLQFQLDGSDVPACASFEMQLEHCSNLRCDTTIEEDLSWEEHSLRTYEDGASRVTKDFYLILPYSYETPGTLARLQVRVGQAEHRTLLWIENEDQDGFVDAGPVRIDAGATDAGASESDAALAIDAGP